MIYVDNRNWKAIHRKCRAMGICPTCRKRKPKKGRTSCRVCIKRAGDRRRRWRKAGLCVDCRVKTKGKRRRCGDCQHAHQAYKRERRSSK